MGQFIAPKATTTQRLTIIPDQGELLFDTTTNKLYGGDGTTAGGFLIGNGDVSGPSSAVNNRVVFFDGTTGKLIKDSGLTLSGTNTGDQTITLTGDVTGSGTGSFAASISAGSVTLTKMANLSANSIIGNNTGSAATPIALSGTNVTAMLDAFSSTLKGLAPASGGGTTNFLRADGTWAAPPNSGGTVTSVAALTLGTSGTDLSSSVANGTTTPVITLNVPDASATARGALTSTDWSTFNSKQSALSGTGIVKSTSGTISYLTDNSANWDTAYTNRITSLTTTGSSGSATLVSNTLNIPTYTLAGLGGFANPMTTAGDIIYGGASGVATRLAGSGTNGWVLTYDTATNTPKWAASPGGTTYTFSTGLTESAGTVTANLSTGVSGGQSVVGGTAASNNLTLSSTSNATKGKILFGTSAYDEANNRLGIGTASPSYAAHFVLPTLNTGETAFYLSSAISAASTGVRTMIQFDLTTAGSNTSNIYGFNVNLLAGYTGSSATQCARFINSAAGTSANVYTGSVNAGVAATSNGVTNGANFGLGGTATNALINIGNRSIGTGGSTAASTNIGMCGFGNNGTSTGTCYQIGGFFGLHTATPTFGASAALMCDNDTQAVDIFVARDNGTAVFKIFDGGNTFIGASPSDAGFKLDINGTVRAVTSIDTPILRGGTGSGGTLTLSSTSNATKGKILFGTSGYDEANNRLGIGTASPSYPLHIVGGTLTDGQNVKFISATMPTIITATMNAINYQITSAGSSSFTNRAYNIDYLAGYTGSSQTNAFRVSNAVAGTGTAMVVGVANLGTSAATTGTTTGTNIGTYSNAANGNINIGVLGRAITNKNSATNIGVMGLGINTGTSPIEVGGFFGMQITDPTITESASLICDNGAEAVSIFIARDNGTKVWSIADGGNTTWGDAINMAFGTTTGTKIGTATGQKLAFWNKTPIVQPTTSLSVSLTFTANTGTAVNDASTFGGYTLKQIAQALIDIGILA